MGRIFVLRKFIAQAQFLLMQSRTYAQRNNGRSFRDAGSGKTLGGDKKSNIRGVRNLGDANCKMGG